MNSAAQRSGRRHALRPLVLLIIAAAALGCERRGDLDGRRRPIPGLSRQSSAAPAGETSRELAFDLIDNRSAALVYQSGGLVASGRGVGIALVTGGGQQAGWRLGSGARPSIRVDGQVGHVRFPFDRDPGGIATAGDRLPIAIRFRPAARDQLVSLFLNGTKLGDVEMSETGIADYQASAPASLLVTGENELRLFFRYAVADEGLRTAGTLERIAIGRSETGGQSPLRVAPLELEGGRIDAVSLAERGRLSYHVLVPETRPTLQLHVSGKGDASVRVAPPSGGSRELWRVAATDAWQPADPAAPAEIDLSEFAGQLVRLDLVGDGPMSWGRPRILREPSAAPRTPSGPAADHVIIWIVSGLRESAVAGAPAIAELAKAGLMRRAMSRSPTWPQAAASMMTGRMIGGSVISAEEETIAERFKQAGYHTSLVTNGRAVAGDAQGFDRVVRLQAVRADELWKRALELVRKSASERSLTVIWANDPALPWTPDKALIPPEWRSYAGRVQPTATQWLSASLRAGAPALAARDIDYLRALYAAEVGAVDGAIATMRADLGALGLTERTAIIVAGDRGQELFERGGFGEPSGLESDAVLTPLIVLAPGRRAEPGGGPVFVSDLYATALDLGQVPAPPGSDAISAMSRPPRTRVARFELPGKATGIAVGGYRWSAPAGGDPKLYRTEDSAEVEIEPADAPVAARALIGWLALLAASDRWDQRRWGSVTALRPAFAAERGSH